MTEQSFCVLFGIGATIRTQWWHHNGVEALPRTNLAQEGSSLREKVRVQPFPESGLAEFGCMLIQEDWSILEVEEGSPTSTSMVKKFESHSTRGASTSKAKRLGVPLNLIMKQAAWRNASSFAKFYDKRIDAQPQYGEAILQAAVREKENSKKRRKANQ